MKESQVVDHSKHGLPGLVSMFGVRYTTARHTAQQAVDAVFRGPRPRDAAALPHRGNAAAGRQHHSHGQFPEGGDAQRDVDGIPPDTLKRIATTYGTGYDRVLQMARDAPALAQSARPRLRRDRRRNPLCGASGNGPETVGCADPPHRSRRGRPPRRRRGRAAPPPSWRARTAGMSGARATRDRRGRSVLPAAARLSRADPPSRDARRWTRLETLNRSSQRRIHDFS